MPKIKNLLIDLDGTLLNTLPDIHQSINDVLIKNNLKTLSYEQTMNAIGSGVVQFIKQVLIDLNVEENEKDKLKTKLLNEFKTLYDSQCLVKTHPYEGVHEVLKELQDQKYNLFIVTNKPHPMAIQTLDHYQLSHFFMEIFAATDHPIKPDEPILDHIVSKYNIKRDETVMIGDGQADMEFAEVNKIKKIACMYGFTPKEKLLAFHPEAVLENFKDLKQTLKQF